MTIGEKIKYFRTQKNITQKELGNQTGIGEKTVQKYELGIRNPKLAQLQKLAQALDINVNSLVDDDLLLQNYKTIGDIFGLIKILDETVGLIITGGDRDKDGRLDPELMIFHVNNSDLNEILADWEKLRNESLKRWTEESDTFGIADVLELDAMQKYEKHFEMLLAAKAKTLIENNKNDNNI